MAPVFRTYQIALLCSVSALTAVACGGTSEDQTSGNGGASGRAGSAGEASDRGGSGSAGHAVSAGGAEAGGSDAGSAGENAGAANGGASGANEAGAAGEAGASATPGFDVVPHDTANLSIQLGEPVSTPASTVPFEAFLDGSPVAATWSVDRPDIGSIGAGPSSSSVFTPTGLAGGAVTVTAQFAAHTLTRQINVAVTGTQNGVDTTNPSQSQQVAQSINQLRAGAGIGGVGGEGLGGTVTNAAWLNALNHPSSTGSAQSLRFLYPYDQTLFPRGLSAPLLSWQWSVADADAIRIDLSRADNAVHWTGSFGRPAILTQTGGAFVRHPIPQDIWTAATSSAGQLTVLLTVLKDGVAYGPIGETWTIAPSSLAGIIRYSTFGGALVQNGQPGLVSGNVGGAVLSLHVGDTAPVLVAGMNGSTSQCRACHSVAEGGSRLIAQHGDVMTTSSSYDLDPQGSTERVMATGAQFPALYPDGSFALAPSGQILTLPTATPSITPSGLSAVASALGTPSFAPGGQRVAFSAMASPSLSSPTQKLVVMSFDVSTLTFSAQKVVADYSALPATNRPGWPAFLPDDSTLVYQAQSTAGLEGNALAALATREGAKANIQWTNLDGAASVTPLYALNGLANTGVSYLPKGNGSASYSCLADGGAQVGAMDADHADDANMNYQPAVDPIPSGGYAWVVFTSRRLYGNVATLPPFCSDGRGADLSTNVNTKKLWVAAVDLGAPAGRDHSHPAFYLPGQELLAANGQASWALDACRSDGLSCASGDQCCNGFCRATSGDGALRCSGKPAANVCSAEREHCDADSDCCDGAQQCWHHLCAQSKPN